MADEPRSDQVPDGPDQVPGGLDAPPVHATPGAPPGAHDDPDAPPVALQGAPRTRPRGVEAWRRGAAGAILSGFAFGLREVFEAEPQEAAIVMETSGQPPEDLPVEADLDQVPPRHSVVRIRPWLLRTPQGAAGDGDGATDR